MKTVIAYKIIPVDHVQDHISTGWQPQGAPVLADCKDGKGNDILSLVQAVVIYKNDSDMKFEISDEAVQKVNDILLSKNKKPKDSEEEPEPVVKNPIKLIMEESDNLETCDHIYSLYILCREAFYTRKSGAKTLLLRETSYSRNSPLQQLTIDFPYCIQCGKPK